MKKGTIEQAIENLHMIESVDDKVLELEYQLNQENNQEYIKAYEDFTQVLKRAMAAGEECDIIKSITIDIESSCNWINFVENKYMYASGFKDGLKHAFELMKLVQ